MLVVIFSFSGCGKKEAKMDYNEEGIQQVTEFLIGYCNEADEEMMEQWNSMSTFALEQQLTESGLPFSPESFLGALESWDTGIKECGAYIGHGDYSFEATGKELLVTTEAEFEDRTATLEFIFDDKLYLDSLTISAEYSGTEVLQKAGLNTVLGMGTVFAVLIFISLIISLFKYIPAIENACRRQPKVEPTAVLTSELVVPAGNTANEVEDGALAAVIAAAIAASEGTSTDGFVVRSIKRRTSNKWN